MKRNASRTLFRGLVTLLCLASVTTGLAAQKDVYLIVRLAGSGEFIQSGQTIALVAGAREGDTVAVMSGGTLSIASAQSIRKRFVIEDANSGSGPLEYGHTFTIRTGASAEPWSGYVNVNLNHDRVTITPLPSSVTRFVIESATGAGGLIRSGDLIRVRTGASAAHWSGQVAVGAGEELHVAGWRPAPVQTPRSGANPTLCGGCLVAIGASLSEQAGMLYWRPAQDGGECTNNLVSHPLAKIVSRERVGSCAIGTGWRDVYRIVYRP